MNVPEVKDVDPEWVAMNESVADLRRKIEEIQAGVPDLMKRAREVGALQEFGHNSIYPVPHEFDEQLVTKWDPRAWRSSAWEPRRRAADSRRQPRRR